MQPNDAAVFLLLERSIEKSGSIELPAEGISMLPLIREGDICRFVPCRMEDLQLGDICLYQASTGQVIAHRFVRMETEKELPYIFKGDSNLGEDAPIAYTQVIGRLTHIRRGSRTADAAKPLFRAWGRLLLRYPSTSRLLRRYADLHQRLGMGVSNQ